LSLLAVAPSTPSVTGAPFADIGETVELGAKLGSGNYGQVRKGRCRSTGEALAVKTIDKRRIKNKAVLTTEVSILQRLGEGEHHPRIVRLHSIVEDEAYLHIVQECCTGGELFHLIEKEGPLPESRAMRVAHAVLDAVKCCHARGIAHRDLKPENILFKRKPSFRGDVSGDCDIRLVDFGLSRTLQAEAAAGSSSSSGGGAAPQFSMERPALARMTTRVGTSYYIAPEVLQHGGEGYTSSCDLWSVGIVLYILLSGLPPFHGDTDKEVLRRVKLGSYDFSPEPFRRVSTEAKDLVRLLLSFDPAARPTAEEAQRHPFFDGCR
jgi:calcium-dependent protein kinase